MKFSSVTIGREILKKEALLGPIKAIAGAVAKKAPAKAVKKKGMGIAGKALTGAALVGSAGEGISSGKRYAAQQRAAFQYSPSTGARKFASSRIMEEVAENTPNTYRYIMATRDSVNASPFKDEILAEMSGFLEKAAGGEAAAEKGFRAAGRAAGEYATGAAKAVGAGVASAIAVNLATDLYSAIKRGLTRSKSYNNMLQSNPDLKRKPQKEVKKLFGVLHRVAPDLAGNPTIAGSFVNNQLVLESGVDIQLIKTLVDAQKSMSQASSLNIPKDLPGFDASKIESLKDQLDPLKKKNKEWEDFTEASGSGPGGVKQSR